MYRIIGAGGRTFSDYLIAFWDGESTGTQDMVKCTEALKKPYEVVNYYHTKLSVTRSDYGKSVEKGS